MGAPSEKPRVRINPLFLDDDELREPVKPPVKPQEMPDLIDRTLSAAKQKLIDNREEPPPSPPWPMLSGILSFSFVLNVMGPWMFTSLGLVVTGWLTMFWIVYGAIGGGMVATRIGMLVCGAALATLSYAFSCSLNIMEDTSNGADTFEVPIVIEWREWIWNFGRIAVLALQAGLFGQAVQWIVGPGSSLSLPFAIGTLAAFPFVLLGALAADGAWAPLAIMTVVRSAPRLWWAWGIFYLETIPAAVGWAWLTAAGLASDTAWQTPLYSAPLLAAIIFIYARLIGRIAECIAWSTAEPENEREEDDHQRY